MSQPKPEPYNPYTAPTTVVNPVTAFLASAGDFLRDGKLLVVRKGATFPDRCVRCNAPAEGYRLRRNLSWHHPLIYLILLANLLIYIIVALVVRKTAKLEVPLCPEHRASRRNVLLMAWGLVLASVPVGIALGQALPDAQLWVAFVVGFGLFLAGAFYGAIAAPPVVATRIDDYFVWLKRVCPEWMAGLPEYQRPSGG